MRSKGPALVTAGAGFIGAHLVRALVRERISVRVLDNLESGSALNIARALEIPVERVEAALARQPGDPIRIAERCEVLFGDIRDPQAASRACAGVDVVFHQATLRSVPRSVAGPLSTHDVNVTGTLRVLEAARASGVRRLVYASSSVIPKFIRLAMQGGTSACLRRRAARGFTYVDNVVEANLAAARAQAEGIALNIGGGRRHTLIELTEAIGRVLGRLVERIHHPPRIGDVFSTRSGYLSRAADNWLHSTDRLRDGLKRTIEAFRETATAR